MLLRRNVGFKADGKCILKSALLVGQNSEAIQNYVNYNSLQVQWNQK